MKAFLSTKTKKEAVKNALKEFVKRKKAKNLINLAGKIDLSLTLEEFLKRRK